MSIASAPPTQQATEIETRTFTLLQLLGLLRGGQLQIPKFQRSFRWDNAARLQLFDSLQKGYPIGTLLLARGPAPETMLPFGNYVVRALAQPNTLWIVDGQQRLSTLAMALLSLEPGSYRPIFFNLDANAFVLGRKRQAEDPALLPSHLLIDTKRLIRWLREKNLSNLRMDRAEEVSRKICEYVVPAYIVGATAPDDPVVKEIFRRVNNTGRALTSVEVFDALHTQAAGGKPLERLQAELIPRGFGRISTDIIELSVIAVAEGDPGRDLVDQIKDRDLETLLRESFSALAAAVDFLAASASILHIRLLPNRGILPTIARFFAKHPDPHERNRELLNRWVWRAILGDAFRRGTSDYRAQWACISSDEHLSVRRLLKSLGPFTERFESVNLEDFHLGSARCVGELGALLSLEPKLLVGDERGSDVDLHEFREGHARDKWSFDLVPSRDSRTLAALIVHPKFDVNELPCDAETTSLLQSHAITEAAERALRAGDWKLFIAARTESLEALIARFFREHTGVSAADRDVGPIEAYVDPTEA